MQLCPRTPRATSAVFDDPNLVPAGLVPVLALARSAGLHKLAQQHLSVPTDKGANAGLKVASLVAGMVAGADSIDDMALVRHGGTGEDPGADFFTRLYPERAKNRALHQLEAMGYHVTLGRTG